MTLNHLLQSARTPLLRALSALLLLSPAALAGGAGGLGTSNPGVNAITAPGRSGAAWLDLALKAHGGAALRNLKTYRETGTVTIFGPNAQVLLTGQSLAVIDQAQRRVRTTIRAGEQLISDEILTPGGAVGYTEKDGELPLPRDNAQNLEDNLYSALAGLSLGGSQRQRITVLGKQTWIGTSGTAVEVLTQKTLTTYLLADDGTYLGERRDVAGAGTITVLNSKFQTFEGVKVPVVSIAYLPNGDKLIEATSGKVEINPVLSDADFAFPKE